MTKELTPAQALPAAQRAGCQPDTPPLSQAELLLLLGSYPVAYCYVAGLWCGFALLPFGPGKEYGALACNVGWALFGLAFFLWGEAAARVRERRTGRPVSAAAKRESGFWLVCSWVILLSRGLLGGMPYFSWESLALHGCAAYWVVCRMGLLAEGGTGPLFALDCAGALLACPLRCFFQRLSGLFRTLYHAAAQWRTAEKCRINWKSLGLSLLWAVLMLPVVLWAAQLLGAADDEFDRLLHSLTFWQSWALPAWLRQTLGGVGVRLLLSLPVGAYLYGLVGGCAGRDAPWLDGAAVRREAEQLRFAPRGGLTLGFAGLLALYLAFFGVQGGYLFGAFTGHVPGVFTAAQYARQGFFQLCQVAALNFGVLAAAAKCSRRPLRTSPLLRALALALMAANLLLAVTAFSKLALYIYYFGFTSKRLLSSWAVLVLAAGSVLAGASLRRPFGAVRVWVWFAAASFAGMCVVMEMGMPA